MSNGSFKARCPNIFHNPFLFISDCRDNFLFVFIIGPLSNFLNIACEEARHITLFSP